MNAEDEGKRPRRQNRARKVSLHDPNVAVPSLRYHLLVDRAVNCEMLSVRAFREDVQRHRRAIDRRDRLRPFGQEQCVPSRAAGQVERRTVRQQWQEFSDDACGFRGSIPSGTAMFCIPCGKVRWHKKRLSDAGSKSLEIQDQSAEAVRSF